MVFHNQVNFKTQTGPVKYDVARTFKNENYNILLIMMKLPISVIWLSSLQIRGLIMLEELSLLLVGKTVRSKVLCVTNIIRLKWK